MLSFCLYIVLAFALGVAQQSVIGSLPAPIASLDMPVMAVVILVATLRFRDAFLVAIVAGMVMAILSPWGWIVGFALVASTVASVFLVRRVVTHRSVPAFFVTQVCSLVIYKSIIGASVALDQFLSGVSPFANGGKAVLAVAMAAVIQALLGTTLFVIGDAAKKHALALFAARRRYS